MLEEKDIQAIAQLIKASEERMDVRLAETKQDIMQSVADYEERMDVRLAETKRDIMQSVADYEERMDVRLAETKRDIMQSVADYEERMDVRLAETKRDIMQGVAVLMDEHFEKKFDLLAEGHEMMRERLEPLDELPLLDTRVSALEAAVRKLNRDVAQMKKAQ